MAWATPQYSRQRVNEAGAILVSDSSGPRYEAALDVINNWRAVHAFPLNTFQMGLRGRALKFESGAVVAQRTKRLTSIKAKLTRFSDMNLSRMQDIGGCRAVLSSLESTNRLHKAFLASDLKHRLANQKNYIDEPKRDGYRGIHLVYRYYSDKNPVYNDLRIEIQLRSALQHAWATAVETVGTFTRQALKSSQGEANWLRFFALMGSALAIREGTQIVPDTPSIPTRLIEELRRYSDDLNVKNRLETYGQTVRFIEDEAVANAHFFLLELNPQAGLTTAFAFPKRDAAAAQEQYLEVERKIANIAGAEAVLVSVDSLAQLRRAYPNYFLDSKAFLDALDEAIR